MLKVLLFPLWLALAFFAFLLIPFLLLRLLFKLAVGLLVLPFALLAGILGLALGLLGGAVGLIVGLFALGFAVMIPLLPLAFVVFVVWAIVKLASRPAIRQVS